MPRAESSAAAYDLKQASGPESPAGIDGWGARCDLDPAFPTFETGDSASPHAQRDLITVDVHDA
jgi:hypothetical protein